MMQETIWLTGMPRSGTNWFGQIFASHPDVRLKLCPLFSYEFKNALDQHSSADAWRSLLDKVYLTQSEYLDQEYLRRQGLVPAFGERNAEPSHLAIKSTRFHDLTAGLLDKCPEIRIVGIVRHPCAVIHSWLTSAQEFPAGAVAAAEWRSGACRKTGVGEFWGFDDWRRVTQTFVDLAAKYPDRFRIARYEAFVRDPQRRVAELFDWLGLPMSTQTSHFLEQSQLRHDAHQRSVFKSPTVSTRWRTELDPAIAAAILADLHGTPLARFLDDLDD